MPETIFWWVIGFAFVCALVFGCRMVVDLIGQWRIRSRMRKVRTTSSFPVAHHAQDYPTAIATNPRGCDSPEIFRKDTLIRIKILQTRIEENAQRIIKISQRMEQSKRVYAGCAKTKEEDEECE